MEITTENVVNALKKQIAQTQNRLDEAGFDAAPVRARAADLSRHYGSPALDVGTGACACMAVMLAEQGLQVTGIDHASSAVRIAQERAAGKLATKLDVQHIEASRLPFGDNSYQVAIAFDALCHASDPAAVLAEMFRVSHGAVIVTELNTVGRQVTRHLDEGFEKKLPDLLAKHCQDCRQFDDAHHVTYVCERFVEK